MVTEGRAGGGSQSYDSFVCDLHFFYWALKGTASGSIRRLKANVVLSRRGVAGPGEGVGLGLGCKLFTSTSALSRVLSACRLL